VVAGGVDSLCAQTAAGFDALQAISANVTNPMSRRRDGLTLGEGAALFVLSRARAGICLLGAGDAMDAHHISAPDPSGRGAEAAMRAALADAGLRASDIGYLNLHGTGTPHNDAMEAHVVSRVLGNDVPCSSTKPLVGHTLAAAGAIEAAFCWLVLERWRDGDLALPPHRFDGERDPALPPLHLVREGERAAPWSRALMSTSFGFGGSNAALVLGLAP
jgi:3-oxoacyl-[acyl-carrier-protein] synthase-1